MVGVAEGIVQRFGREARKGVDNVAHRGHEFFRRANEKKVDEQRRESGEGSSSIWAGFQQLKRGRDTYASNLSSHSRFCVTGYSAKM